MESPGIRPSSWKVMEMRIAGVTDFSMISPNDYQTVKNFGHVRYLVEFVNTSAFATTGASDAK